jgi:hypothetical protein
MSKLTARSLAFLATLTLAGAASARRPPALVAAQERADSVLATCTDGGGRSSPGYRDMLARVASADTTRNFSVASTVTRKIGDRLVLVCAGGEILPGSGYRGFPSRLRGEPAIPQIAAARQEVGSR